MLLPADEQAALEALSLSQWLGQCGWVGVSLRGEGTGKGDKREVPPPPATLPLASRGQPLPLLSP